MKKPFRGLYWGRFNPPHNGHLRVIEHLLERECDELVVAIGSSLSSHEPRNPFTGGERQEMLEAMLKEAGLEKKTIVVKVPDVVGSYVATAENVVRRSPRFDVVFTNRPVIKDVFGILGKKTKTFPDFGRGKYSSTNVRKAMLSNKGWRQLVPAAVGKWMADNGGVARMRLVEADRYEKQVF